jgi:DNA-binding SARP family transcriptional activator/tetratricopeptide (TPR) repeat protein
VTLSFDQKAIDLGGAKTKALVVRLLIDHNLAVPVDSILDALWPETDRAKSEVTLRSMISRLRQRLRDAGVGDEVIVTRPPGYMLVIDPDWIDVTRFERLLATGRASLTAADAAYASKVLGQALLLWRGPALSEVREEPFAQAEARRLDELRLNAVETRIEAELLLGHHHEVIGELESLTEDHWTRERLWCQRMVALYRCGRQAEALRVFQNLRDLLVSELGVEPGLEASRIEHQILAQTPDLEWTETAGSGTKRHETVAQIPLPSPCTTAPAEGFVGRQSERDRLTSVFQTVSDEGIQRFVFIGGEPGIGKTSLATEVARQAHGNGAIVLFGRADEDFCGPYQPWAEAIAHLVEHASPDLLRSLAPHSEPLVRMIPRLSGALGLPEVPTTEDSEAARYVWFGAVLETLRTAGNTAPVLLVLDDLQWADVPSLRLLRHVAASAEAIKLLVIGIFRESDVGADHPMAHVLGDGRRMTNTERIGLRGLNDRELQHMMERIAGQELSAEGLRLRDAILDETDGNPFFVGELLQHLVDMELVHQSDGRWVTSANLRQYGLPASVREVIAQRVARLGDMANRVLSVASVIGREFDYRLLAATCEIDENELLDVLDVTTDAALVLNTGGDSYNFVHALVEHTLYDTLTPARRARIHRQVAVAIERRTHLQPNQRVIELAYHWAATNDPENVPKAAGYALAAGDEALRQLAPDEALRWYATALALFAISPDEELRCRLLIGVGTAQRQTGDPAFRENLLEAAELAQELGSDELLVAAALANNRGYFSIGGETDAERVAVLEAACAVLEGTESADQARLLGLLAMESIFDGDLPRRRAQVERALAIARASGPAALAAVGNYALTTLNVPDELDERLCISSDAVAAAEAAGDVVLQFWCAYWRSGVLLQAGDVASADACQETARQIADRLGQPTLQWAVTFLDAARAIIAGNCDEAERLATLAAEIGAETGQPDAGAVFATQLGSIRRMQGRGEEIVEFIRGAAAENPGIPGFATSLALFCVEVDRMDEARAATESLLVGGWDILPSDLTWLFVGAQRAQLAAELNLVEPAQKLFDLLLPYADQYPFVSATSTCQVTHFLGLLAATLGRYEEADSFFERAVSEHGRIGAKWCLATTWLAWGESLAGRPVTPDTEKAATLLHHALNSAQEGGYGHIERRASRALGALGTQ